MSSPSFVPLRDDVSLVPLRGNPAPAVLLLDLDNTVYAYAPCHRAGLAAAQTAAAGLDPGWSDARRFEADYLVARAEVKEQIGKQAAAHSRLLYFKTMAEQRDGRSRLAAAREIQGAYWRGYFAAMRRDEGCAETLAEVRERGLSTVWITSFTTRRQMLKLERLGLAAAVDHLLTTEEAGFEKPDGRLVDLALARLGGARRSPDPTTQAWMVGDSLSDDQPTAEARRLPFVWFRRDDAAPGHGDAADRATYTVSSWNQLREVLRDAWNG